MKTFYKIEINLFNSKKLQDINKTKYVYST